MGDDVTASAVDDGDPGIPTAVLVVVGIVIAIMLVALVFALVTYYKTRTDEDKPRKPRTKAKGSSKFAGPSSFGPFELKTKPPESTGNAQLRQPRPVSSQSRPKSAPPPSQIRQIPVASRPTSAHSPPPAQIPTGGATYSQPMLNTMPATNSSSFKRADGFTIFKPQTAGTEPPAAGGSRPTNVDVNPTQADIYHQRLTAGQADRNDQNHISLFQVTSDMYM